MLLLFWLQQFVTFVTEPFINAWELWLSVWVLMNFCFHFLSKKKSCFSVFLSLKRFKPWASGNKNTTKMLASNAFSSSKKCCLLITCAKPKKTCSLNSFQKLKWNCLKYVNFTEIRPLNNVALHDLLKWAELERLKCLIMMFWLSADYILHRCHIWFKSRIKRSKFFPFIDKDFWFLFSSA